MRLRRFEGNYILFLFICLFIYLFAYLFLFTQVYHLNIAKTLKCPYDQIFYFHFFTFSCTIRPSYSSCQISIHYEHQKSFYFNIYFREFTAAINQPCSKAWLQMGESDVKDSNIPHGLKL